MKCRLLQSEQRELDFVKGAEIQNCPKNDLIQNMKELSKSGQISPCKFCIAKRSMIYALFNSTLIKNTNIFCFLEFILCHVAFEELGRPYGCKISAQFLKKSLFSFSFSILNFFVAHTIARSPSQFLSLFLAFLSFLLLCPSPFLPPSHLQ